MRSVFKLICTVLIFIILSACTYVDIGGLFVSSYVNDRFNEKDSLASWKVPDVSSDVNFSFLIVSDLHYYKNQPHYFRTINDHKDSWKFSFVVIMGDIAQNGMQSSYDLAEEDISTSIKPVLTIPGNHDLYNGGWKIYRKQFGRSIYSFEIGNSYFIFLDTANGTLGSLQRKWLEQRLRETSGKHVFVFSHYNLTEQEFQSGTDWPYPEEKYDLIELLGRYRVDYFFCGHLHLSDVKILHGVKHIVLKNLNADDKTDAYLKITVNGSNITETYY